MFRLIQKVGSNGNQNVLAATYQDLALAEVGAKEALHKNDITSVHILEERAVVSRDFAIKIDYIKE